MGCISWGRCSVVRLACGLTVELALTQDEWEHGLAGHSLHVLDGMLFIFPVSKRWPVYALDLCRDLWVYWLDERGELIADSFLPKTSRIYYLPILDARYILETKLPMPWQYGEKVDLTYDAVGFTEQDS